MRREEPADEAPPPPCPPPPRTPIGGSGEKEAPGRPAGAPGTRAGGTGSREHSTGRRGKEPDGPIKKWGRGEAGKRPRNNAAHGAAGWGGARERTKSPPPPKGVRLATCSYRAPKVNGDEQLENPHPTRAPPRAHNSGTARTKAPKKKNEMNK